MDVDVAVAVGFGVGGIENEHLVKLFRTLRPIFEHGPHRGIPVYVRVFPLDVVVLGVLEGQILHGFHQTGVHFPDPGPFGTVEDEFLGRAGVPVFDQHLFHGILYLLHGRRGLAELRLEFLGYPVGQGERGLVVVPADRLGGLVDRIRDLFDVERTGAAVSFRDAGNHVASPLIGISVGTIYCVPNRNPETIINNI